MIRNHLRRRVSRCLPSVRLYHCIHGLSSESGEMGFVRIAFRGQREVVRRPDGFGFSCGSLHVRRLVRKLCHFCVRRFELEERHRLLQLLGLALISSAVAASSSELDAFCCVVWLSWLTAALICPTPDDCSSDAAVISCTRSDVLLDVRHHLVEQLAGLLRQLHAAAGHFADLLRRHLAALGQLAHLGRHHREALAVLAGTRRLDRRVQGQQIGLVGDVVDDADLLARSASSPPPSP